MKNYERFIRWQAILRDQLTFLNSLLLTISIGIIGFVFSSLTNIDFNPIYCQKLFLTIGLVLIFLSIVLGLSASFSRLIDYRTTTKKIKNEIDGEGKVVLEELKRLMKLYGKTTWFLFYSQVVFVTLGIINLMISFILIYSDKLF